MKQFILSFITTFLFLSAHAQTDPNQSLKTWPEDPVAVTALNASNYKLSGYCDVTQGDVNITFGTLSFTTPCNSFFGFYQIYEDVSVETTTNPIRHCVTQSPYPEVCSKIASNELAPPGISFLLSPLDVINTSNGSPGTTYRVSGSCAPVGATISIDFNNGAVVFNGSCQTLNAFNISGDVSALADGTNIPVVATITSGAESGSASTTVSKFLVPDPVPVITAVNLVESDGDSDSWLEDGDYIDFVVDFSETVKVDSIVTLDFNMTSGVKTATYKSGSPSTSITFRMNIASGDDQCDGALTATGVSMPGTGIKDLTGQLAGTSSFPSSFTVTPIDAVAPTFGGLFNLASSNATPTQSPKFNGPGFNITENCSGLDLKGSIIESVSQTVVQADHSLPASAITNQEYRFFNGVDGFLFNLAVNTLHYITFTAEDPAGNTVTANSTNWTVSPAGTLPNLIVHLTGKVLSSIIDENGVAADASGFTGSVDVFNDVSESTNVHNFTDRSATARPTYNLTTEEIEFDGVNDCMRTGNHADLNIATVVERSYGLLFKSDTDITTRQTVFEEGAQVRGMNVYIDQGKLHCGFWNQTNDGDGYQAFIGQSVTISPNTIYNISPVFDYTNYAGPNGVDGTFTCYIDGLAMGTPIPSTSRLFAHSGDVSLGCNGTRTIQHDGQATAKQYFKGNILELMVFNSPPDATESLSIYNYLKLTWDL